MPPPDKVASKATAGRPRSEESRLAILEVTFSLLLHTTVRDLTIELIASSAGVGRSTIYRWWPSKAALVMDAVTHRHLPHTPMPSSGSAAADLAQHVSLLVEYYAGDAGRIMTQVLAEGQYDAEVLREFRERFFNGRRAMVHEVLERGRQSGEFRPDFDLELVVDLIYAPIYLRLMFKHLPLDHGFGEAWPHLALAALAPASEGKSLVPARSRPRRRSPPPSFDNPPA